MNHKMELSDLLSARLTAVCFVLDYVEFHFDDKIIRSFVPPVIESSIGIFRFPDHGSRDAFCKLINSSVEDLRLDECMVKISFGVKGSLNISLTPDKNYGPEAAHFVPGDDMPMSVW